MFKCVAQCFVTYKDLSFESEYFCQGIGGRGFDIVLAWEMGDDYYAFDLFFCDDAKLWIAAFAGVDTGDISSVDASGREFFVDLGGNAFMVLHALFHAAVA